MTYSTEEMGCPHGEDIRTCIDCEQEREPYHLGDYTEERRFWGSDNGSGNYR